jgi:very-short-patch-repair endonuclease
LFDLGVTKQMIATQVSSGRLLRLRHRVYLASAAWPDDPAQQHLLLGKAELAANPAAVLSGASAALAWAIPNPGFTRWHELPVAISLPAAGGHSARSGRAIHRLALLPEGHVVTHPSGLRVTSPARTAIDIAADLDLPEALVVLDAAARTLCESFVPQARRSDFANPRLAAAARERLEEAAEVCRVSRLGEAIAAVNPARESAAESLSAGHIMRAGLPEPLYQAKVESVMGPLYPDCLWSQERVVGECDGAVKYADSSAWVREKQREQVLRDLGFTVVRWLAKEIMLDPMAVIDRLARALAR